MEFLTALWLMLAPVSAPYAAHNPNGWCADFWVTGYSVSDHRGNSTRDGTIVTDWRAWTLAAVDPTVIPMQSRIEIPSLIDEWGIGELRAADTGGGVKGLWIDVLTLTNWQAYQITGLRWACVRDAW